MLKQILYHETQIINDCILRQIQKENKPYVVLMSARSNGKTFAMLEDKKTNKGGQYHVKTSYRP